MGNFFDKKELFRVLKKRINLILICIICALAVVGGLNALFIDPVYESTTQILVNSTPSSNSDTEQDVNEIRTNKQLIETYSVVIESPELLNEVINRLGNENITVEDLQDAITIESEANTLVMNVSVSGEDPANTALIANTVVEVFQENIVEMMPVEGVTILSYASVGEKIKPNTLKSALFATFLGIVVGVFIAFIRERLNTTITNEESITEMFEVPILGTVSGLEQLDKAPEDTRET